jgi:hypothetical protein
MRSQGSVPCWLESRFGCFSGLAKAAALNAWVILAAARVTRHALRRTPRALNTVQFVASLTLLTSKPWANGNLPRAAKSAEGEGAVRPHARHRVPALYRLAGSLPGRLPSPRIHRSSQRQLPSRTLLRCSRREIPASWRSRLSSWRRGFAISSAPSRTRIEPRRHLALMQASPSVLDRSSEISRALCATCASAWPAVSELILSLHYAGSTL